METHYILPGAEGSSALRWPRLLVLLALLLSSPGAWAQAIRTLPGDYASFSAAITDINGSFPNGGVTVRVAAGYVETAPAGGLPLLTAQGTGGAAGQIIFQKAGTGANPLIQAGVGTSTTLDGIVRLSGTDYVTFNGIDLLDPASNTSQTTAAEYGYGMFRASATNGCQNNTIQNCTVTMNRSGSASTGRIYGVYLAATDAAGAAITTTAATGSNSGNTFYANTILNTQVGFQVLGFVAPSAYTLADQNNDFGGTSAATGNIIRNLGGAGIQTAYGMQLIGQSAVNASYNTVDNAGGGGVAAPNGLGAIYVAQGQAGDCNLTNNQVTLLQAATGDNGTATGVYAGHTGTGTINLTNNVVSYATTSATIVGINPRQLVQSASGSGIGALNITGNQLTCSLRSTGTGGLGEPAQGVSCGGTVTGAATISNNTVTFTVSKSGSGTISAAGSAHIGINTGVTAANLTISTNTVAYTLTNTNAGGSITASSQAIVNSSAVSGTLSISGNTTSHTVPASPASSGTFSGALLGIFNTVAVPGSLTVSNNTFTYDITNGGATISPSMTAVANQGGAVSGTASFNGNTINVALATSAGSTTSSPIGISNASSLTGAATISNNTLTYTGTHTGGTFNSSFTGISSNAATASTLTIDNNTLLNSSTTSTGAITVIQATGTSARLLTISNNRYQNSSTASTANVRFINASSATPNLLVQGNFFTGFTCTGINANYGYYNVGTASVAGTHIIRNNVISGLSVSGNSSVYGLYLGAAGISTAVLTTGNKVTDLSMSGTTGSAYGIAVLNGASNTLYNNLISNLTAPASTSNPAVAGFYLNGSNTLNAHHNTVYLGGTGPGVSAAYYRAGTDAAMLRNNLLYNERTGSGSNYALATASTAGLVGDPSNPSTNTSDYNLLFTADASKVGLYGATAYSFAGWKTATGGDGSSLSETTATVPAVSLFTDASTADLSLQAASPLAWYANGTGTHVVGVGTDYLGAARPTTVAAGAPDIGAFEVTPTSIPPALAVSAAPALGGTQAFSLGGRTLATLTYGSTGTVPSSVVARYYSGTNPPTPFAAGARYANAYFDFSNANGDGSGYTYQPTLNYDPALLGTISGEAVQRISQRNSANSGYGTYATTVSPAPARTLAGPGALTELGILTISDGAAPLPVQLVRFEATRQGNDALLSWATAAELDNQVFEVQVSPDGQQFRALGFVAGAGTSALARSYEFADREAGKAGLRYYRLRQVDRQGTATFSPVRTVLFEGPAGQLVAWPNPCQQAVHLSLTLSQAAASATLTLTDVLGHQVLRQELGPLPAGPSQPTLDTPALRSLPAGIYVLRLITPTGTQTLKLVKE